MTPSLHVEHELGLHPKTVLRVCLVCLLVTRVLLTSNWFSDLTNCLIIGSSFCEGHYIMHPVSNPHRLCQLTLVDGQIQICVSVRPVVCGGAP